MEIAPLVGVGRHCGFVSLDEQEQEKTHPTFTFFLFITYEQAITRTSFLHGL